MFNTIARIPGTEKPNEYVMLSAHLDSWDAGSGATDNGTGTITMLEAMRILKTVYPQPKRTILVGHWSGEEEGDIGSGAFAADHPEILSGLQALFNQDNGTGEIDSVQTNGFIDAAPALARWMSRMPADMTRNVTLMLPGVAHNESTDSDAFDCRNAPGFFLTSSDWSYGDYTWHTNRDTYDKINFDNVKRNATLVALFAYQAAEDPTFVARTRRVPPIDPRSGSADARADVRRSAAKLGGESAALISMILGPCSRSRVPSPRSVSELRSWSCVGQRKGWHARSGRRRPRARVAKSVRTAADGQARFAGLEAGRYRVEVHAIGFGPGDVDVQVTGQTTAVRVELDRVKVELDTIRVVDQKKPSVRLEAFQARRREGIGRFLTEQQLADDRSRSMQWVMSTRFPASR